MQIFKFWRFSLPKAPYLSLQAGRRCPALKQQAYENRKNDGGRALPRHALAGYLFLIYATELLNFALSALRLRKVTRTL